MRHALEEPAVPVPDYDGAVELLQALDRPARLGPRGNVAEADEPVDSRLFEVLEDGFEGQQVPVQVGDQAEAHGGTIRCHSAAARSRPRIASRSTREKPSWRP
jgi:hypothetical protein